MPEIRRRTTGIRRPRGGTGVVIPKSAWPPNVLKRPPERARSYHDPNQPHEPAPAPRVRAHRPAEPRRASSSRVGRPLRLRPRLAGELYLRRLQTWTPRSGRRSGISGRIPGKLGRSSRRIPHVLDPGSLTHPGAQLTSRLPRRLTLPNRARSRPCGGRMPETQTAGEKLLSESKVVLAPDPGLRGLADSRVGGRPAGSCVPRPHPYHPTDLAHCGAWT